MAHQYLFQLESEIRHAALGNAGTLISFHLGAEDAGYTSREFDGRFEVGDLTLGTVDEVNSQIS